MQNPFDQFDPQAPTQTRTAPGFIPGTPKTPDPYQVGQDSIANANEAERIRIARENADRDAAKFASDQADKAAKEAAAAEAQKSATTEIESVLSAARKAKELSRDGWFATGFGAGTAKGIGGTTASDVKALLDTIGGNTAFDRLQRMREASPTGGAVGQVSDTEQQMLKSTIAALDQAQSDEQFQAQMDRIIEVYSGILKRIAPEKAQQQDNQQQGLTLTSGLPNAGMGSPDSGLQPNGVQDAATGGLKAVPEFRGMSSDVQSMVQQGASADQIVQYVAQRHAAAGFDPPNAERVAFLRQLVADHQARPDIPVSSLAKGWQTLEMVESADKGGSLLGQAADSPVGAAAIGAADAVTGGFLDEITGALGGNTDNARAVMKASQQERPISTIAGNIAGGALLPIGKATSPLSLAKAGAAYGGVYGAGSADGNIGDRLTGGAIGALAGGVSGYAGGKAIGALQARSASRAAAQGERNALLQDFKAQGVDPMAANVGGPASKVATGGAGQAFFSAGSIRNAAERQTGQFGEAVGKNAAQAGSVLPADEAGLLARTAAERYSKQTSQRGAALYDRAYQAAGGEKIVPQSAISEIDAQIARLSQSPDASAASLVKELGAFKKKLEEGVSIVGLRDARTRLSQGVYDGKLRSSADQQVYRNVLDRISTDIQDGLQAAGKDRAAGMFRTADKYWSERVDYIDKVLEPIVGKNRSGEQILQSVESMATGKGGGVARLRDIMRSLSDEERGNVQATIIDRIGRATKGAQGAEGETFSANTFLTNWNGLSQKGKSVLFGNSELRQSLDQLARVAASVKDTTRYANTSNSAGALGWQAFVSTGAYTAGGLPSALLAAGGQYITGKMLASPRFAAWLARAPKKPTAQAVQAYTKRLHSIAAAEPVIAADIGRFSQFLNAANDVSPVGAAAQGQQENN